MYSEKTSLCAYLATFSETFQSYPLELSNSTSSLAMKPVFVSCNFGCLIIVLMDQGSKFRISGSISYGQFSYRIVGYRIIYQEYTPISGVCVVPVDPPNDTLHNFCTSPFQNMEITINGSDYPHKSYILRFKCTFIENYLWR